MSQLGEYQLFRRILCVCPCCNKLTRISDLKLKVAEPEPKTWLDEYEAKDLELARMEEAFEEEQENLRKEAKEKGRETVEKALYEAICPSLKKLELDLFDVRPIFYPIDFVVFEGMNREGTVRDIRLLTREHDYPSIKPIQDQIKNAVIQKKYKWELARVQETGNIVI